MSTMALLAPLWVGMVTAIVPREMTFKVFVAHLLLCATLLLSVFTQAAHGTVDADTVVFSMVCCSWMLLWSILGVVGNHQHEKG